MERIAIYPGSFDPLTYGHLNIIERGRLLFDKLIVAVAHNTAKKTFFEFEERVEILREILKDVKDVEVDGFQGLLVDYAVRKNATVILRGIRTVSDFEYEFQMALANKMLNPSLETVFMMTDAKYSYLSSTLIKEIVHFGGSVTSMVPPLVEEKLKEKYEKILKEEHR